MTFETDLLRAYMKELLQSTLKNAQWPEPRERDKVKAWMKEIGERVKKRMLGAYLRPLPYPIYPAMYFLVPPLSNCSQD